MMKKRKLYNNVMISGGNDDAIANGSEINNNHQYTLELREKYAEGSIVVFVGAGLSKALGIPDWANLIKRIMLHFIRREQTKRDIEVKVEANDYWGAIELIKSSSRQQENIIQRRISEIIREEESHICVTTIDNNIKDLSPFENIATTNYDLLLEKILNYTHMIPGQRDFTISQAINRRKVVYHLHGSVEAPTTIVISQTSYDKLYCTDEEKKFIETLFSSKTILFLGYSFKDKFLMELIEKNRRATGNNHYAITFNLLPQQLKNLRKLNIYSINFMEQNKTKYVERIRNRIIEITKKPRYIIYCEAHEPELKKYLEKLENEEKLESDGNHYISYSEINLGEFVAEVERYDNYLIYVHKVVSKSSSILYDAKACMAKLISKVSREAKRKLIVDRKIDISMHEWMIAKFKEVVIEIDGYEYSLYTSEEVNIKDAQMIGAEVHVSTAVFFDSKILLNKRQGDEVNAPNYWATPGGRLQKQESFEMAAVRTLYNDCKITVAETDLKILDTFCVKDKKVPGVLFYTNKFLQPIALNDKQKLFSLSEVEELHKGQNLANDFEKIRYAFTLSEQKPNKKLTIKIRIILSTICNFKCQLCHHENITGRVDPKMENIKNTLNILARTVDVKKITITGGEPFLVTDKLFDIIDYIKATIATIYPISIITNGSQVLPHIPKLKEYRDSLRLKISLYGHNQDSFTKYTQDHGRLPDYRKMMFELLGELNKDAYLKNYTLNVVYNKIIKDGLFCFLKELSDLRSENEPIGIKIIDMVRPQNHMSEFTELYTNANELCDEASVPDKEGEFNNILSGTSNGIKFQIYQYPCHNERNCRDCIRNFALTVKPNGDLLVCEKAVNSEVKEMLKGTGINIEWVNFKDMYGI